MEHYATLTRTGPVDSIVAAYIPKGELLEPGMNALHGREAIRNFLTPLAAAFTVESASMTSDTVDVHGHVAYQWGRYDQRAGPNGGPVAEYRGRFVAEWHQEADGQWRLARLLVQPFPPQRS